MDKFSLAGMLFRFTVVYNWMLYIIGFIVILLFWLVSDVYLHFTQGLMWRLWNTRTSASLSGMLVVRTRYVMLALIGASAPRTFSQEN